MIPVIIGGETYSVSERVARIICELVKPRLLGLLSPPDGKGKAVISWGGKALTIEVTETITPQLIDTPQEK